MQRLSSPLDALKPAYDVVVVGSGYGGGVAASRLSRAGLRVCVIERGREFLTGEFPARLPELRRELQIVGEKMRSGRRTGLFDFRLGSDIHVLIGCGLGGGSLINAAVGLRPDARVFADAAWPGEVREDGLLDQGFARARTMLTAHPLRESLRPHQISRARNGKRLFRSGAGCGASRGQLRGDGQSRRRRAACLHALRRLLLGVQCRRQEHRGAHLSSRRQGPRR